MEGSAVAAVAAVSQFDRARVGLLYRLSRLVVAMEGMALAVAAGLTMKFLSAALRVVDQADPQVSVVAAEAEQLTMASEMLSTEARAAMPLAVRYSAMAAV